MSYLLRGALGTLNWIYREKLLALVSKHPIEQRGSPCCYNFLTVTQSYHSKVNPVGSLNAVKLVEAVFLPVFNIYSIVSVPLITNVRGYVACLDCAIITTITYSLAMNEKCLASNIRKRKYSPATTAPVSRSGDPPLDSETGWTGELWSNHVLLIL